MLQPSDRVPPKEFAQLLQKYADQQCTEAEKQLVEEWYEGLGEELSPAFSAKDLKLQEEALWQKIDAASVKALPEGKVISFNTGVSYLKLAGVAASLLILVGCFSLFRANQNLFKHQKNNGFVTVENHTFPDQLIRLPDGSQVALKKGSKLRYDFKNDNRREVFLVGEAFFAVTKNPNRPFVVHTGNILTKVLGTSFTVKYAGGENQEVEVQVKTGKVAVTQQNAKPEDSNEKAFHQSEVLLSPNQRAKFNPQIKQFTVQLVTTPAILNNEKSSSETFLFRETELHLITQKLEKAYGIQIILPENLQHCPLTADLTEEDFYAKLDLICEALQAEYEIRGTRIYLSGKGCEL
ncbi:anti-sigma factor [Adhaeribacter aerolatus]|uniref:Anti-sigma factor n=1 Tax=Adhaeribacter aerolatus TaxID=670289 RepID=A0A512B5V4_9BACT|nr:FecR family protein [Adhaeribacter aerolatus]GEO07339.1 anti-sigma factor [Adhaeribacter aerolatus]